MSFCQFGITLYYVHEFVEKTTPRRTISTKYVHIIFQSSYNYESINLFKDVGGNTIT